MPLPAFRDDGWLPEGHFPASWDEITASFGGDPGTQRAKVLANLLEWRDRLREKGMGGMLVLDGSFVSAKPNPGDFDCIFVYDEETGALLERDPEALELISFVRCKERGYGDVFAFAAAAAREYPQYCRLDGFDEDKVTKRPKGVVEVLI